jgi:hypothetical protein
VELQEEDIDEEFVSNTETVCKNISAGSRYKISELQTFMWREKRVHSIYFV